MHVSSDNRPVSGIIINLTSNYSCSIIVCSFIVCDNDSTVYVNHEYTECIDYIESLYNKANCSVIYMLW